MTLEDRWTIGLEDKTVKVGEKLLYPVKIIENSLGETTISVDLVNAGGFLSWEAELSAFAILAGATREANVGSYRICMEVLFFNATYREEFSDCFRLMVEPQPVPEETTIEWTPPEKKAVAVLPKNILVIEERGLELGSFKPEQPIPQI